MTANHPLLSHLLPEIPGEDDVLEELSGRLQAAEQVACAHADDEHDSPEVLAAIADVAQVVVPPGWEDDAMRDVFSPSHLEALLSQNLQRRRKAVRAMADALARRKAEREDRLRPKDDEDLLSMVMGAEVASYLTRFACLVKATEAGVPADDVLCDALVLVSDMWEPLYEQQLLRLLSMLCGGRRKKPTRLQWILHCVKADRTSAPTPEVLFEWLDGFDGFVRAGVALYPEVDRLRIEARRLVAYEANDEQVQSWTLDHVVRVARGNALTRERASRSKRKRRKTA